MKWEKAWVIISQEIPTQLYDFKKNQSYGNECARDSAYEQRSAPQNDCENDRHENNSQKDSWQYYFVVF